MATVSFSPDDPLTYFLELDSPASRLAIAPERGGIVTEWQWQGQRILYFDHERFQDPNLSVRGGIPILFPICGNLPQDQYQLDGQTYRLKQHGFARDLPWQVVGQQTQAGAALDLQLRSSDATLAVYPFPFELLFRYHLQGNTLRLQQTLTNLGDRRMPFSLGFHPYFDCSDKTALQLSIPAHQYRDQKTSQTHPYHGPLDLTQPELDLAFTHLSASRAHFTDTARQLTLTLTFSDLYQTLVFWAIAGKDYICLEPWSAPRNALNSGEQLAWIDPHSTREAWIEITLSSLP